MKKSWFLKPYIFQSKIVRLVLIFPYIYSIDYSFSGQTCVPFSLLVGLFFFGALTRWIVDITVTVRLTRTKVHTCLLSARWVHTVHTPERHPASGYKSKQTRLKKRENVFHSSRPACYYRFLQHSLFASFIMANTIYISRQLFKHWHTIFFIYPTYRPHLLINYYVRAAMLKSGENPEMKRYGVMVSICNHLRAIQFLPCCLT